MQGRQLHENSMARGNLMENPVIMCAQCGRIQLPDGSWREPIEQEEGDWHPLSREGVCPWCVRTVSSEQLTGSHQNPEAFALGALVQFLGALETAGEESTDAIKKR